GSPPPRVLELRPPLHHLRAGRPRDARGDEAGWAAPALRSRQAARESQRCHPQAQARSPEARPSRRRSRTRGPRCRRRSPGGDDRRALSRRTCEARPRCLSAVCGNSPRPLRKSPQRRSIRTGQFRPERGGCCSATPREQPRGENLMARAASKARTTEKGLAIERRFSTEGVHPYEELEWETRDAIIGDPQAEGGPAFEQRGVEFPKSWSQNATNIVAQKYFRGQPGSPERETSVKQMVSRVAGRVAQAGREAGYFATEEDGDAFEAELTSILVNQKAAFNSPVWFNVGWK